MPKPRSRLLPVFASEIFQFILEFAKRFQIGMEEKSMRSCGQIVCLMLALFPNFAFGQEPGVDLEALGVTVEPDSTNLGGFTFGPDRVVRIAFCEPEDAESFLVAVVADENEGVVISDNGLQERLQTVHFSEDVIALADGESMYRLDEDSFIFSHILEGSHVANCTNVAPFLNLVEAALTE